MCIFSTPSASIKTSQCTDTDSIPHLQQRMHKYFNHLECGTIITMALKIIKQILKRIN
jgi:hypothetical protein